MFGKLNNGELETFTGKILIRDNTITANPREQELKDAGYLEVEQVEAPEITDYEYLTTGYILNNDKISPVYEVLDKEVSEAEYPTNVADGYHVERREDIGERAVVITYEVVPDEVEVSVEVGDINATTDNDNIELAVETESEVEGQSTDN